ncbi:hypothetical protein [Nocardia abscessus]|uniref:hypothetical protein n=1 Tax=Nocardia abscessus TaxID=120957 RepID=UPI0024558736|nr:hypothetical protein [Nocardia abscessus]
MRLNKNLTGLAETVIFAHPSLGEYFGESERRGGLRSYFADSFRVEFIDYSDLKSADVILDSPVLLPVNTEHQADNLRSVREHHPMALLVAITNDVTGHPTYYAIRSGATFVVNLAIPSDYQSTFVQSQLHIHTGEAPAGEFPAQFEGTATSRAGARELVNRTTRRVSTTQKSTVNGAAEDFAPADIETADSKLGRTDLEIIRMLQTPMTVAEIARRNYISERSMYRRIRKIYNFLGITGRVELIRSAGPNDPLAHVTALQTSRKPGRPSLSAEADAYPSAP